MLVRILRIMVAATASFALAAIGVCAIECVKLVRDLRQQSALAAHTLQHVDATVTDLDRTVQIAGGAINEARRIERDNRAQIAQVNQQTLATLQHVDALVVSFDQSQQQASTAISNSSAALVPVMARAAEDLKEMQPVIHAVQPLLMRTTDVAANLSNATADVEHEIHKLVYPQPRKWYQKYFLDPIRTAAHLVTIPVR
jgi:hypothetical protein